MACFVCYIDNLSTNTTTLRDTGDKSSIIENLCFSHFVLVLVFIEMTLTNTLLKNSKLYEKPYLGSKTLTILYK